MIYLHSFSFTIRMKQTLCFLCEVQLPKSQSYSCQNGLLILVRKCRMELFKTNVYHDNILLCSHIFVKSMLCLTKLIRTGNLYKISIYLSTIMS